MRDARTDRAAHGAAIGPVPDDVRRAVAVLRRSLRRPLFMKDLARECGVPERTLNAHFRAFVGHPPMLYLRRLRLAAAREELLSAGPGTSVTEVAGKYRFDHAGRFSEQYRACFGEAPSATLRRARSAATCSRNDSDDRHVSPCPAGLAREKPTLVIALQGSASNDPTLLRVAEELGEAVAADLAALRSLDVLLAPPMRASGRDPLRLAREMGARYLLAGRPMQERGRLRVVLRVLDGASGRHVWGDSFDGAAERALALQARIVKDVRRAIVSSIRGAEIERATRRAPADLDAYGLSMRALPLLLSSTSAGTLRALELLHHAMELDPDYELATALAAWGHGQLVMHNATEAPNADRERARQLALRAGALAAHDPLALTARGAVHMMLHDLDASEALLARALARDPSSGWAWGRSGWLNAYRGDSATAIAHFRRALRLEPELTRANILVGIGTALFDGGRYAAAASCVRRAMHTEPGVVWANRSLSVAYARLGETGEAARSLDALRRFQPDLTVGRVVSSVPFRPHFLERLASGLNALGLPP